MAVSKGTGKGNTLMNFGYVTRKLITHSLHSLSNLAPNATLAKNKIFKHKHKGERCFILGSGHSIKNQDLTKLENEIVITQNNFHVHQDIKTISPSYHCVIPQYQSSAYDSDWIEWIKDMEERLPQKTMFFFGLNTKNLIESKTGLANRTYYIQPGLNPLYLSRAKIDITKKIMNIPTVITECLTVALYMGFANIYILGQDMDQICRMNELENVRFYGHSPITKNKAEYEINERQNADGTAWWNRWLTIKQLNLLKVYAESKNIDIVNLTTGGLLNTFERDSYNVVMKNLKG